MSFAPSNSQNPAGARLLARCRQAFLDVLGEFARSRGYGQPETIAGLCEHAGAAFDELAGLRDRKGFEAVSGLTASRISLVHEEDLEFTIVLSDVARRLREHCDPALGRLHQRMMRLLDQRDTTAEQSPVGPEAACRGLRGLCEAAGLDPEERLRMVSEHADTLGEHLLRLYRALDGELESAGLHVAALTRPAGGSSPLRVAGAGELPARGAPLAALRRALMPADSAVPQHATAHPLPPELLALIHQWIDQHHEGVASTATRPDSNALAALLAPERAAAVLAVERAFDAIASDPRLAGGLRLALARLQIPLLKLALHDDSLFAMADHPANRLMQSMAAACAGLTAGTPAESPWCARVDAIARGVQRPAAEGGNTLNLALGATEALIHERLQSLIQAAQSAQDAALRAERHEQCLASASRAVRSLLADGIPGPVCDFLELYWVHVLARSAYTHGEGSTIRSEHLHSAAELVDSVDHAAEPNRRRQLLTRLPDLINRLQAGLDLLGLEQSRRNAALGPCMDLHSALIRGATPPPYSRKHPVELRLRPVPGLDHARQLMHGGHSVHDQPQPDWLAALQPGDWLQLATTELGSWHGCVGWIGPHRQIATLVTPTGDALLLVTLRALAELAARNAARVLEIVSPLELAVQGLMAEQACPA